MPRPLLQTQSTKKFIVTVQIPLLRFGQGQGSKGGHRVRNLVRVLGQARYQFLVLKGIANRHGRKDFQARDFGQGKTGFLVTGCPQTHLHG